MAVLREQPYGNARFEVEIQGIKSQAFTVVHLPEFTMEATEYREGTDKDHSSRKVSGRPSFTPLRMWRGFQGDLELYQWWRVTADGDRGARRTVVIRLMNEANTDAVAEWKLMNAWPARYSVAPLIAQGGEVLLEHVEIVCDRVELS